LLEGAKDDAAGLERLSRLATNAWDNFCQAAGRFGLTPADRARLRQPVKAQREGVMSRQRGGGQGG
jgi:hypothetical protein